MVRTLRQIKSKLTKIRKRIPKLPKNDKERFGLEVDRDMLKLEKKKIIRLRRGK